MKGTLNNVNDLYNKIDHLLNNFDLLKINNDKLSDELKSLKNNLEKKDKELSELKKRYESLKLANSITDNKEKVLAKKKLKKMIEDIDECILNLMG